MWIVWVIVTIVVSLASLAVIVVIVGLLLPERFSGEIDVDFDQPIEKIWDAIEDYQSHPMTGKMMKSVESLPDQNGLDAWVEDMGHGERITVRTVELERPNRIVREMEAASMPMTSRWVYQLKTTDAGCRVSIDAETFLRRGSWMVPIFRCMMVVGGGVRKGLKIQLDMVAKSHGTSANINRNK